MFSRRSALLRVFFGAILAVASLTAGARPAAAQTGAINGFVLDSLGRPIEGATVVAATGPSSGASATTIADGSYQIPSLLQGDYQFQASAAGFSTQERNFRVVSGSTGRVDFNLDPDDPTTGGVIRGVVTRSDTGERLQGATATLTARGFNRSQTTGTEGAFEFTDLERGTYGLSVSRPGFRPQTRAGIRIRNGSAVVVNFALNVRSGELSGLEGTVRESSGRAIHLAHVRVLDGTEAVGSADTNRGGVYRVTRLLPGTYDVEVSAAGFGTKTIQNVELPSGRRLVLNVTLTSVGPATGTLEGFITNSAGAGIPGALVTLTEGPVTGHGDNADPDGFYQLRNLPAGHYTVRVSHGNFSTRLLTADVNADASTRLDVVLTPDPSKQGGSICGRVTGVTGSGLSGVSVSVTAGPSVGQNVTSDADGDYCLIDLPAGPYTVQFSKTGFTTLTRTGIDVASGAQTTLNVSLEENTSTGTLRGTVRDSSDTPISGVQVQLLRGDTVVALTNTGSTGTYLITGVPVGRYSVRFTHENFQTLTITNVAIQADQTTVLDVRLGGAGEAGGRVEGFVRDIVGIAVQNALVELIGPTGAVLSQETDSDGHFAFTDVVPGSGYAVRVSAFGMVTQTRSGLIVSSGETVRLTFTLQRQAGFGGITGIIRNSSGIPISGAKVAVVAGPINGISRLSGSDGRYNFAALPAGSYTVDVSAPGFRTQRASLFVRSGTTTTRNFYLLPLGL
jgi:hypothetical protein